MTKPPADTEPQASPALATETAEFVVASHEALFAPAGPPRCDACGAPLEADGPDDRYGVCGQGVYLRARGDEVRFDNVPLCPSCAAAIGMTALARWEIEEDEG